MTNTSAQPAKMQPEYVVDKPVPNYGSTLTFLRRTTDGDRYLAKEYNGDAFPEIQHLRSPKPDSQIIAFEAAARVLNHENLISIAHPIQIPPEKKNLSLIYEFCADGNLKQLFDDRPVTVVPRQGFLPEGMVWHVALSMLRALTFLHEGWRERIVLSDEGETVTRNWYRLDDDWMPILHRSIRPENIHFQGRKGKETYGLCKLGDFGRCLVSGSTRIPDRENVEVVACLNRLGGRDLSALRMRAVWKAEKAGTLTKASPEQRIYTIGSELANLGGILYRMMTGDMIPIGQCRLCGCVHVREKPGEKPCGHDDCMFEDIDSNEVLMDNSKYSEGLREVVINLIRLDPYHDERAYVCYERAWPLYRTWKTQTPDGLAHWDHYDDLVHRKRREILAERQDWGREGRDAEWEDHEEEEVEIEMWSA